MAAIDKIYVNSYKEYKEFEKWLLEQPKLKDKYGKEVSIYRYFFNWWDDPKYWSNEEHAIFSAPYYVDAYIIRNCPLDYIQKNLMLNYGSSYQEILDGEIYNSPSAEGTYETGKHFKIIKKPFHRGNYPMSYIKYGIKRHPKWDISVSGYMWWHSAKNKIGTWDFLEEFVVSDGWSSSNSYCPSLRSIKRRILKWKLPVGTVVTLNGMYVGEYYKIIVKR